MSADAQTPERRRRAGLPAWSEPFSRPATARTSRRSTAVRPDRPARGRSGTATGTGIVVAIVDSGRRGRAIRPSAAGCARASGSSSTARTRRSSTTSRSTPSATGPPAPGSSIGLAPRRHDPVRARPRVGQPRARASRSRAGLEWAIEQGASIVNLSLSSRSEAMYATLHDLVDRAYFANVLLVCAANNVRGGELSVAVRGASSRSRPTTSAIRTSGSTTRAPPVEFGAYGLDVDVAWKDGGRIVATGNSFAAPHIAGLRGPDPGRPPDRDPVRDQDDPRRDGDPPARLRIRRGPGPDRTTPRPDGPDGARGRRGLRPVRKPWVSRA